MVVCEQERWRCVANSGGKPRSQSRLQAEPEYNSKSRSTWSYHDATSMPCPSSHFFILYYIPLYQTSHRVNSNMSYCRNKAAAERLLSPRRTESSWLTADDQQDILGLLGSTTTRLIPAQCVVYLLTEFSFECALCSTSSTKGLFPGEAT